MRTRQIISAEKASGAQLRKLSPQDSHKRDREYEYSVLRYRVTEQYLVACIVTGPFLVIRLCRIKETRYPA
jgi:hypothetical protein